MIVPPITTTHKLLLPRHRPILLTAVRGALLDRSGRHARRPIIILIDKNLNLLVENLLLDLVFLQGSQLEVSALGEVRRRWRRRIFFYLLNLLRNYRPFPSQPRNLRIDFLIPFRLDPIQGSRRIAAALDTRGATPAAREPVLAWGAVAIRTPFPKGALGGGGTCELEGVGAAGRGEPVARREGGFAKADCGGEGAGCAGGSSSFSSSV